MKKILSNIFLFTFVFSLFFGTSVPPVQAQATCPKVVSGLPARLDAYTELSSHTIVLDYSGMPIDSNYYIKIKSASGAFDDKFQSNQFTIPSNSVGSNSNGSWTINDRILTLTLTGKEALTSDINGDESWVQIYRKTGTIPVPADFLCRVGSYTTTDISQTGSCSITVEQERGYIDEDGNPSACYAPGCMAIDTPITIKVSGLKENNNLYNGEAWYTLTSGAFGTIDAISTTFIDGALTHTYTPSSDKIHYMQFGSDVDFHGNLINKFPYCKVSYSVFEGCNNDNPESCLAEPTNSAQNLGPDTFKLCTQVPVGPLRTQCIQCAGGIGGKAGVWTAVGCINREPQAVIQTFIRIGLGIAGGVALLMFLGAGLIMSTSQGDAKKVGDAKDMMTAAVVGLIFIIFSVTILQFIGFSILKIPGFGG